MKTIHTAAIAALLATSAQAFAGIAQPNSGDSEMFLVIYNPDAQVSFTQDLGIYSKAFRLDPTNTGNNQVLASGSEFTLFAAAAGSASNWRWFVNGADALGSALPNARSAVTTLTNGRDFSAFSNPIINGGYNAPMDAFVLKTNFSGDAAMMGEVSMNGTAFGSVDNGGYALLNGFTGNNGQGLASGFTSDNGMGEQATIHYITRSSTSNLATALVISDVFKGGNGQALNYALTANASGYQFGAVTAVPEPGTYALMFAGLGMLGFLARRRRG